MAVPDGKYAAINRFMTVAVIPLLFWNYTRITSDSGQVIFFLAILSLAVASSYLSGRKERSDGTRSVLPLLWTGVVVLYTAMIVWNRCFRREILDAAYRGDIFRQVFWNFWAPLYGHPQIPHLPGIILIGLLAACLYGALKFYAVRSVKADPVRLLAFFAAFNLILIVAFALSRNESRLFQNIYDYKTFGTSADMLLFHTLHDVWEKWNALMPVLHGRNPHYPPGNLFLLKVEQVYNLPGLFKTLVILATLSCVPLLYFLGRTLGLDRTTAMLAVALFVTSASPTIFPTTSPAPVTMFFSLSAYLGFFTALRNNSVGGALACGIALALYSLMSFSVFIMGLSIFLIGMAYFCMAGELRFNTARAVLLAGLTFLASLLLVYELTGFSLWSCLVRSVHQNSHLMTAHPFDTISRYLLRSTGNLLAFAVITGIVPATLAAAGWLGLARAPRDLGIFIGASLATLLAAGFSGLFFLETERIWVFFTPFLALSAGWGIRCRRGDGIRPETAGLLVMISFLTTSVQELCFQHYWN